MSTRKPPQQTPRIPYDAEIVSLRARRWTLGLTFSALDVAVARKEGYLHALQETGMLEALEKAEGVIRDMMTGHDGPALQRAAASAMLAITAALAKARGE